MTPTLENVGELKPKYLTWREFSPLASARMQNSQTFRHNASLEQTGH